MRAVRFVTHLDNAALGFVEALCRDERAGDCITVHPTLATCRQCFAVRQSLGAEYLKDESSFLASVNPGMYGRSVK